MTLNLAATIEKMESEGLPPEVILRVLKCLVDEGPQGDAALERRRAADRERQAKYRANKAEPVTLHNVTNVTDTPSPLVPPLSPVPLSPPIIPPTPVLSDLPSDSKPKRKTAYSPDFEDFWKAYPTDPGMSKQEAGKAWAKLSDDDRTAARLAIPAFKTWVSKQGSDYRTVHACRYLSQRRFDGFAQQRRQPVQERKIVPASPIDDDWTKAA